MRRRWVNDPPGTSVVVRQIERYGSVGEAQTRERQVVLDVCIGNNWIQTGIVMGVWLGGM